MRGGTFKSFLATMLTLAGAHGAAAGDWSSTVVPEIQVYNYEAWGGAEATSHSRSYYGGMTTALSGDVRTDGFRLRSAAGYGTYSYTSPRWDGQKKTPVHFEGVQSFQDVMLGFQYAMGPWIVKVYAGWTQDQHLLSPFDTKNPVQGKSDGVKGAIETWLNVADKAFVQSEMNWTEVFNTYGGRVRLGYRINPALSMGLEAAANGNAVYDSGRAGSFARFEWSGGEISASGGVAGDRSSVQGGYGSAGLLFRF